MAWTIITKEDGSKEAINDEASWGYRRKHYACEHMRHKEFYDHHYTDNKEADKIIKKILRHFKVNATWDYRCSEGHGHCHYGSLRSCLHLPRKNISLGLICHEIAHVLAIRKWGRGVHHNRKFQTQNNKVCTWAKRYLTKSVKEQEATTSTQLVASQ
jgi:hypothetical protein